MILIADSGSSKTDWRLIDDEKKIHQFKSSGLNPYFLDSAQIEVLINRELSIETDRKNIKEIFFYGAGCSNPEKCNAVEKALQRIFVNAKTEVMHDILAACRSLCGKEEGMVAILGTGSNSCVYDGSAITDQVPSLGFILGDEGSGTHLGKKLLQSYFYRELSKKVMMSFDERFHLSKETVLESIYQKTMPNRFFASFTHFIFQNRNEPEISEIVYQSFTSFFNRHLCKYNNYRLKKLHCTGSVGYYFGDTFRLIATEQEMEVGKITESPIAGLTLYHLNEV